MHELMKWMMIQTLFDIDMVNEMLEPEKSGVVFKPSEAKSSLLGLDVPASEKRGEGLFKVPRPKVSSMMTSIDEDVEKPNADIEDVESGASGNVQKKSRKYRDSSGSKTFDSESQITEHERGDRYGCATHSEIVTPSNRSSRSSDHRRSRRSSPEYDRREGRVSSRHSNDRDYRDHSEPSPRHGRDYKDYGNKRSRYEGSRRTPGRSDWEDGNGKNHRTVLVVRVVDIINLHNHQC